MTSAGQLVLFYRDFQRFSGGHLKVWNYFNHVMASPSHQARIAFSAGSQWDESNPWHDAREFMVPWKPETADILFLAGTDWSVLPEGQLTKPVLNLIQHPRHAEAGSELRRYLRRRALRICVSREVADAINQTDEVNGPVFVIPNGVDLTALENTNSPNERDIDILICGLKAPEMAETVGRALSNLTPNMQTLVKWLPRQEYLKLLRAARITVFLPRPDEGFYLPAIEGMAAGTLVICPDCIGNRTYCLDGVNCFRPENKLQAIVVAARAAFVQSTDQRRSMIEQSAETAGQHSLAKEREQFLRILVDIDSLLKPR